MDRFRYLWIALLASGTLASAIVTVQVWPNIPSHGQSIAPTGGLGLFVVDPLQRDRLEAEIEIELRTTGHNEDVLVVTMMPTTPGAEADWVLVASGQYSSDAEMTLNVFCPVGGQAQEAIDGSIECEERGANGSVEVRYTFGEKIGYLVDGQVREPAGGLVDYDPARTTVITGSLRSDADAPDQTTVWIPIQRMEPGRTGGISTFSYAGIGGGFAAAGGYGDSVRSVARGFEESDAFLAVMSSGVPLVRMSTSRIAFSLASRPAAGRLDWADPQTDESETLSWSVDDAFLGPVSFSLRDPFEEVTQTRRSFWAGVAATVTIGFGLLLLESALVRRRRGAA